MAERKRVAVVGAGISGLCAIKSCLEEGIEPVCFEQDDNIGGVWYYTDEYREGQGARMYERLTSNVTKEMLAYSDFPFPREAPIYLTCDDVFRYLNSYCDHFGLRKYIHLNTKVKNISKADDYNITGKWLVEREDSITGMVINIFDFVMVCAGFLKTPIYPDIPGMELFQGSVEHSMTFKDGRKFKDKSVLVVGTCNPVSIGLVLHKPQMEYPDVVAVYCSWHRRTTTSGTTLSQTDQVDFSVGAGMVVVPRTVKNGIPFAYAVFRRALFWNPEKALTLFRKIAEERLNHDKAGLSPSGPLVKNKLCVHDHLQIQIYSGKVKVVSRLVRLGPREAELEDGTCIRNLDCIIFATGFDRELNFLENDAKGGTGKVTTYKMMFPLQLSKHSLALIGCINTNGTFPPLPELQSRIAARVFSGKHSLPSPDRMVEDVDRWNQILLEQYGTYKYTMPNLKFREELADELRVSPSWWDLIKAGPRLAYLYYYGPAFPYHNRLWGPHRWTGARQAIEDALQYGYFTRQPRKVTSHSHKRAKRSVIVALAITLSAIIIAFALRVVSCM